MLGHRASFVWVSLGVLFAACGGDSFTAGDSAGGSGGGAGSSATGGVSGSGGAAGKGGNAGNAGDAGDAGDGPSGSGGVATGGNGASGSGGTSPGDAAGGSGGTEVCGDGSFMVGELCFTGEPSAPATSPELVEIATLNTDGVPDVVFTDTGAKTIGLLVWGPQDGFEPPQVLPFQNPPKLLAVPDLNADGLSDLATNVTGFNSVMFLIGNGDAGFSTHASIQLATSVDALLFAPMNVDEQLELIVLSQDDQSFSVFPAQGDSFGSPTTYVIDKPPTSLAALRIDGDDQLDLVVGRSDGTLAVFINKNDSLLTGQPLAIDPAASIVSIAPADFDGDSRTDVALALTGTNAIAMLTRTPDGGLQLTAPFPAGGVPRYVRAADLDGDGLPELVYTLDQQDGVRIVKHPAAPERSFKTLSGTKKPAGFAIADFTADDALDIVVADPGAGQMYFYRSNP